jgi:hypothetical protein
MRLLGHTVTGLSSSNGYHLPDNLTEIIEIAKNCDIFFNNAHAGIIQATLIERLYDQCSIVTSGSMAADYNGTQYRIEKLVVERTHRKYKKLTSRPMLLLKMGYLEYRHEDKYPVPFDQIVSGINYWLENPRVSMIEFENDPRIYTH